MSNDPPNGIAQGPSAEMPHCLGAGSELLLGDLRCSRGDKEPLREFVEPYLAALLQVEHLNLLVGSGLTTGLAQLAQCTSGPNMNMQLAIADREIAARLERSAKITAEQMGRGDPNFEDRLRVAIAAADGLEFVFDTRSEHIRVAIDTALNSIRSAVNDTECALNYAADRIVAGQMSLRGLLMTFLGSFAGRVPTRDRLHVFTTNYDRVIEWGAELAGLRIVDRFVGSLEPVFRSSRLEVDYHYSPPGSIRDPRHLDGVFRLSKLHGSIDWRWESATKRVLRSVAPFGRGSSVNANELLVYPNSAKDVETLFNPYADLFRDYSSALCRPHTALVTYGYSFGDDHINRVIKDMLTIPSTHLLAISYDDSYGRISRFALDHQRLGQVSLMIGPEFASLPALVGKWLPRPSAEFLLQSRAKIYRARDMGRPLPDEADPIDQNDSSSGAGGD